MWLKRIPLVPKLIGITALMFAFSLFVMPPLYTLFCEVTGINGKTEKRSYDVQTAIDESREITVQFIAINSQSIPWKFSPESYDMKVHPGEVITTFFNAKNNFNQSMTIQAIPSVAPAAGSIYFNKTECFCFNQQTLNAGEEEQLGLQFVIDREIPSYINKITLSYTLFDVSHAEQDAATITMQ